MYQTTAASVERQVTIRSAVLDYLVLIKPGIVALVLVSTLGGMYIAQKGLPATPLVFWSLVGIALSTAGAATLNNFIDRDIDTIMRRTSGRPLPSGSITPKMALVIGLVTSALSVVVFAKYVNMMAMFLSTAAIFIYAIPYTLLSKRVTPLATFIGGVGGALPPVIGYAAVKPGLDVVAFTLFLIIFAWQHPHFWALALKYRDEYASAGVRNLPVARGVLETKKQILVWASLLAMVSTLPFIIGVAGKAYLACAMVSGVVFVAMSLWFLRSSRPVAMCLFHYSIVHLPLLFTVMVVDIIKS
ncbi:MAG: protoheme IX farnesyltransferase [Nitrospinae bacterium]|nr:protoheme IX farnesyltransferase [Nitrospinota bacterium]